MVKCQVEQFKNDMLMLEDVDDYDCDFENICYIMEKRCYNDKVRLNVLQCPIVRKQVISVICLYN